MDEAGRISRRALLLGGAAVAVGAGVGAERVVGRDKILRKLGLASSPDYTPRARGPKPVTRTLDSVAMRGEVRYAVAAPGKPLGGLLCLHGRGSNYRFVFDGVHVHDMAAEQDVPLAVVGVNGGANSYWHERASGIDPQTMLHDELLPQLQAEFGEMPWAVMGWSMGGYGALLSAQRHPATYRAVVAVSPALFRSYRDSTAGSFDSDADFRRHDVTANVDTLEGVTVRVDCGTEDPFIDAAREFAASLPTPNPGRFSRGFHDAAYWRSVAPSQVRTIATALGL